MKWLVVVFLVLTACTSQEENEYGLAMKNVNQGHYRIALGYFERLIKRDQTPEIVVDSAREAARISLYEIKDFQKAINYYHVLVLRSTEEAERIFAQKQIASIYFDNLQDYQKAIEEFSKLQQLPLPDYEKSQYKMSMARAHFYLNNFDQAESEINALLKLKKDEELEFFALALRANIYIAKTNYKDAIVILNDLMKRYPKKSFDENIAFNLALCYEEELDFKNAIAVLETLRGRYKPAEYIELRIKRVEARSKNAPGAKGFRK